MSNNETDRIIGTEMEWPVAIQLVGNEHEVQLGSIGGDNVDSLTNKFLSPRLKQANHMLSNGSRYYADCGDRVEYASPEDASFDGAVINEMAGERVVMESISRYMQVNEKVAKATLLKRVVSDDKLVANGIARQENVTWGYHVNLSADTTALEIAAVGSNNKAENFRDEIMHLLALHLASSSPLLGQGAIYESGGNYGYSFGQKALGLTLDYVNGTTGTSKPVINQRNEPLADVKHGLSRVHITSMDPSISPWGTKMLLGTSSLVLRAIEQGRGRGLRLKSGQSLRNLSRQIATDPEMHTMLELEDGRTISAAQLQREIIAIVETTEHTDQEAAILKEWKRAVDDLDADMMRLTDRSDAIAKLALLKMHTQRKGMDPNDFSPKILRWLDREYDTVAKIDRDNIDSTDQSAFYESTLSHKLRHTKFQSDLPADELIERAFEEPPMTTRAYVRGKIIQQKETTSGYWTSVSIRDNGAVRAIPLSDPRINIPPEGLFEPLTVDDSQV